MIFNPIDESTVADNKVQFETDKLGAFAICEQDSTLPKEYRKVNYLESSGTQGLKTGYSKYWRKYEIKFSITQLMNQSIIGALRPGYANWQHLGVELTNGVYKLNNSGYMYSYNYGPDLAVGTIYELTQVAYGTFTVNGVNYQTNNPSLRDGVQQGLFGRATYGGGFEANTYARIYSFKGYDTDGTTLIRDYVPCVRKYDSVPGMYDLVNDTFISNCGTGNFIVG